MRAKNRGQGGPTLGKKKTNGLVGAKSRGGGRVANLREKEKTNGIVGAKNRGQGRPT